MEFKATGSVANKKWQIVPPVTNKATEEAIMDHVELDNILSTRKFYLMFHSIQHISKTHKMHPYQWRFFRSGSADPGNHD